MIRHSQVRLALLAVLAITAAGCHVQPISSHSQDATQICLFIDMYNYLDKRPLEDVSTEEEFKTLGQRSLSLSEVAIIDFGYYRFVVPAGDGESLANPSRLIGDAVIINTLAREYVVWRMSKS